MPRPPVADARTSNLDQQWETEQEPDYELEVDSSRPQNPSEIADEEHFSDKKRVLFFETWQEPEWPQWDLSKDLLNSCPFEEQEVEQSEQMDSKGHGLEPEVISKVGWEELEGVAMLQEEPSRRVKRTWNVARRWDFEEWQSNQNLESSYEDQIQSSNEDSFRFWGDEVDCWEI